MDKAKLLEIYNKIVEYDKIIIGVHKRPDGDCLGTAYGLKNIIKTTWPKKTVYVAAETVKYLKLEVILELMTLIFFSHLQKALQLQLHQSQLHVPRNRLPVCCHLRQEQF